ncbi:heparinase II/III domain-containing protein [Acinetobacter proteolyticus]|uniref:heparinase II/III domain-containing protein n=1 Tax=Acinetobacter proteolyticus TaxID=1776741 RepID=UPI0031CF8DEC
MVLGINAADYSKWGSEIYKIKYIDFLNAKIINNGVYVIDLGGISLDILVQGLGEYKNDYCLVIFSGALNKKGIPPFFSGATLAKEVGVPLISISDPSLSLSEDLMLAWYAGNHLEINLPSKIAKILDNFFQKLEIQPILMGGSGGGFASLLQTSLLKTPVKTVVWNPQISLSEFNLNMVLQYLEYAFPSLIAKINLCKALPKIEHKDNIKKLLDEAGVIHNIFNIKFNEKSEILYLQNINDNYHVKNQLISFYKKRQGWERVGLNSFTNWKGINIHVGEWGEGHIPPSKTILINIVNEIILGRNIKEISAQLSLPYGYENYISKFNSLDIELSYKIFNKYGKNYLEITLNENDSSLNLEYAVYFIKDKERIRIDWYQKSPVFEIPESGIDAIHVFSRDFFDNKLQSYIEIPLVEEDASLQFINNGIYDSQKSIGENILKNNIWHTSRFGNITLGPDFKIDWKQDPFNNRSWVWLLHQLSFIRDLLAYDQKHHTNEGLIYSDHVIQSWWINHKEHPFSDQTIWHDHGSALRLRRLMDIKSKLIEKKLIDQNGLDFYDAIIKKHIEYLAHELYYSKGTNHGLDQTITLFLAVASSQDQDLIKRYLEICKNRLIFEVSKMFDTDGGHFENSPHYQGLGINQLNMINNLLNKYKGILDPKTVVAPDLIEKAAYVLSFMISPLGKFIPIGDTEAVTPYDIFSKYHLPKSHVHVDFALSLGQKGVAPTANSCILEKSGWAIYRDSWKNDQDFYLAAKCGFKSNYHRQDDDTSFILYYKGQEWFTDSGLYNYQENDQVRQYVRSHKAHTLSFPNGITPIRRLQSYEGNSSVALAKNGPEHKFLLSMHTDIFKNFSVEREIAVANNNNFSVNDQIYSKVPIEHKDGFTTRFIIPDDKQVICYENHVDIVGNGVTLRLSMILKSLENSNLKYGISVSEVQISKIFNKLVKAKVLEVIFESHYLDVGYNFEWIQH